MMPDRIWESATQEEAFEHGRTQERLLVARTGLAYVLRRIGKSQSTMISDVRAVAELALEMSDPGTAESAPAVVAPVAKRILATLDLKEKRTARKRGSA